MFRTMQTARFPMRILVVDDDETLAMSIVRMIRQWGGEANAATSALHAIKALDEKEYDFVLLDLRMPERDGCWFMENARIPEKTKIILMTGFTPKSILARINSLGACDYIEKPFGSEELMATFERHVRRETLPKPVTEANTSSTDNGLRSPLILPGGEELALSVA
jgi:DNA-binding response OmpR family regulator